MRVEKTVGVSTKASWHPETVHLVVNQARLSRLKVFILFELLQNGLTLKLADVGPGPPNLIADDAHEAQVVVSLTLLAPLLIGALRRVAQFTFLVTFVVVVGNFLLDRLVDVAVVFGVDGRAVVHGLESIDQLAQVEAQVAPLQRELGGV